MSFQPIVEFLKTLLSWWFIVEPWEQAVRIRFGSRVRLYGPGAHWRLPFFDVVYVQNCRRRLSSVPLQTLTTRDGHLVVINGSLGYVIKDVLLLHQTLHCPEGSLQQEVCGLVASYVAAHDACECLPEQVSEAVKQGLDLERYGLGDSEYYLVGYVSRLPAVRLVQDSMDPTTYWNFDKLEVAKR